jgi:hypothetical protein
LHPLLNQLLESAASADRERQNEALADIALILERSWLRTSVSDTCYAALLPPALLAIRLEENDQREVVEHLSRLATSDRAHPSIFWAIGKSTPKLGIGPLLMLLQTHSDKFDEETTYQALIALENFLVTDKGVLPAEVVAESVRNDPTQFLNEQVKSDNSRIAIRAQRVLRSLRAKL